MQKITPFLWFDNQAEESSKFYTSIFKKSKILITMRYDGAGAEVSGRPKGSVMTVTFRIEGQDFTALNGGPIFRFNPSISFMVQCTSEKEIDFFWEKLSAGGNVMMEFGMYPFAEKYGWLNDRYGVSWQLIFNQQMPVSKKQKIVPCIMFVGANNGRADEAIKQYTSIFPKSKTLFISRYAKGDPDKEGNINHGRFRLCGQEFGIMESSGPHEFTFNSATSFVVDCKTQKEVDYFWNKLTAGGAEVQCGWLSDKFGVAWQIVPEILEKLLASKNKEKSEKVMAAMLKMVKIDIAGLKKAFGKK